MVHLCLLQDLSILCYPFNVELARFEIFVDELRLKQGHCDCAIVGEGHNWLVVCGPVLTRFGTPTKTTDATDIIAEANDHCRFKVEDKLLPKFDDRSLPSRSTCCDEMVLLLGQGW